VFIMPIVLGWVYYAISVMFSGGIIQGNEAFFTYCGVMIGVDRYIKYTRRKKNEYIN
jgi:hypothetical protein